MPAMCETSPTSSSPHHFFRKARIRAGVTRGKFRISMHGRREREFRHGAAEGQCWMHLDLSWSAVLVM